MSYLMNSFQNASYENIPEFPTSQVIPGWNVGNPRPESTICVKYLGGYLYVSPREFIIGSMNNGNPFIYKLLLKTPIPDDHLLFIIKKYDINISFANLNYFTPMNLFFLYFIEELLPMDEYQEPYYDIEPVVDHVDSRRKAEEKRRKLNDAFWNYLFKQIKLVSRKPKLRVSPRMVPRPRKIFSQPTSEQVFSAGRRTRRTKK